MIKRARSKTRQAFSEHGLSASACAIINVTDACRTEESKVWCAPVWRSAAEAQREERIRTQLAAVHVGFPRRPPGLPDPAAQLPSTSRPAHLAPDAPQNGNAAEPLQVT